MPLKDFQKVCSRQWLPFQQVSVTWEYKMKINAAVSAYINAALVPSVTKVGQSMQEKKRFSTNNY